MSMTGDGSSYTLKLRANAGLTLAYFGGLDSTTYIAVTTTQSGENERWALPSGISSGYVWFDCS